MVKSNVVGEERPVELRIVVLVCGNRAVTQPPALK
jgi:hypothetical protein